MKRRRKHMVRKKKGELKAVDIKRTGIRIRNPDPESGSGIRIRDWKKCRIRIRIKPMRIRNTEEGAKW
jgi:hypothetical protein